MYRVIKRDNSIVDFNLTKIKDAMSLAFQSRQKPCHPDVLDLLALKVTADFSSKVKDELVNVEDIQDSVESVLIQAGYADVAKAYILYRRQREKLRNMKNTFLDYRDTVNKYLNVTDWLRQGEFNRHLFRGRAYSFQQRRNNCQLLAQ